MSLVIALCQIVGLALVAIGLGMWSVPLALVVFGVLLCSAAVQAERKGKG
jgi:hypothetical protein